MRYATLIGIVLLGLMPLVMFTNVRVERTPDKVPGLSLRAGLPDNIRPAEEVSADATAYAVGDGSGNDVAYWTDSMGRRVATASVAVSPDLERRMPMGSVWMCLSPWCHGRLYVVRDRTASWIRRTVDFWQAHYQDAVRFGRRPVVLVRYDAAVVSVLVTGVVAGWLLRWATTLVFDWRTGYQGCQERYLPRWRFGVELLVEAYRRGYEQGRRKL